MSFWDTITIKYPEWCQLSNGRTSVHMCEILRTKYFKISYGSEKYVIVPLLHNKHELL